MWILGRPAWEFAFLYLPALVSVAVAVVSPDFAMESVLYAVIFFAVFFLWFYIDVPYLWAFVVYATLYHHVRQVYGFSKWYQKLNGRMDPLSDVFLYLLSYLPMVIYHFRTDAISGYYTENDLFLHPSESLTTAGLVIYLAVFGAWMVYEWALWRKGIRELNRILSVAFPAFIYGYCFLLGATLIQVLFPLLFLHGVAYVGVLGQSLSRTQKKFTGSLALLTVAVTAVLAGLGEFWFEENLIEMSPGEEPLLRALLVVLWLTPLFCHYAFDAIIWRKGHRESAVVFVAAKE